MPLYPKPSLACLLLHQMAWCEDIDEKDLFYCPSCDTLFKTNLHTNVDIRRPFFRRSKE